jgi:hypothetical protein
MEPGFLLDRGHVNALSRAEWLEGEPEKAFLAGLKTKGKDRFPVTTFRCDRCGYLESYADAG